MLERIVVAIERRLEQRRRFRAALAYNRRYTFSLGENGHSWQCPSCGRVHRAHSHSKFDGPQFDACCDLPAGGRQQRRFALPLSQC